MSSTHNIQVMVQRMDTSAPPEGLQRLAEAVLRNHTTPALNTALRLAEEVLSRHTQRTIALHRQADQLRAQLVQIEHQLAG